MIFFGDEEVGLCCVGVVGGRVLCEIILGVCIGVW